MSKVICAHFKKECPENLTEKLKAICKKIEPDNISANEPIAINGENCVAAIMNPLKTVTVHKASILLGNVLGKKEENQWHNSGVDYPDGSYAIFRNNPILSEFVTDSVATRTIWYYFDEDMFLASTSQRALILFLGNFEFDDRCIPWVLSTGSLGPEHSWDKRVFRIPPSSAITLDKENWKIELSKNEMGFKTIKRSKNEHQKLLKNAITNTFQKLRINIEDWALPLSGGYDSRGILYFMLKETKLHQKPNTLTWGLEQSQYIKGNDGFIAKQIAEAVNVPHKYYHTNISDEPLKTILDRFITVGEGRIDHIGGYMDGFKIWKTLFEDGVQGTVRGDECFGHFKVSSEINVRQFTGCTLCSDYSNLKKLCEEYGIPMQQLPTNLKRQSGESIHLWRDRIYRDFRMSTVLAALSDLKLSYVEQTSPLLSYEILNVVQELPDKLRSDKFLFRKIIDSLEPKIEYANKDAIAELNQILKHPDVVRFLKEELIQKDAKSILPVGFLEAIINNLKITKSQGKVPTKKQKTINYLKRLTPQFIKNFILSNTPLILDYNLLAFRVYIIIFMHKLLNNDLETQ